MRGRAFRILIVVAAAILLHLPAHFAPWSGAPLRELLPEDGPAFARNETLAPRDGEGPFAAARRAASDPAAAWDDGADIVGAAHWRPAATTLYVAERAAPWAGTAEGAVRGAALVSLLLHVLVVLGAMRLATSLGGGERAAFIAGLLAAASPAALAAAAWPARQAAVLATALALGGTLLALRGGAVRLVAAGCVLALAGLAHEAAFGWILAVPLLRRAASGGRATFVGAWPCAVAPIVAFAVRWTVVGGLAAASAAAAETPAAASRGPNALDGVTGIAVAIAHFLVPSRSHFADGPFVFPILAHLTAIVALAAGVSWLVRRFARPAGAASLAAVAALAPLVLVGTAGAAPYQDAYLYLVLPLAAAAAGLWFADVAARRGAAATAGIAAAALLVGASVAATVVRAPAFRTRKALIELAKSETPRSLVVRAWDLWDRLGAGPSAVPTIAEEVRALAHETTGADVRVVRGDAVTAATLSRFFVDYVTTLSASPLPLTDSAYDAADEAGAAATVLRPRSARTWNALAQLRMKTGALRGALDAISHAITLSPDDVGLVATGTEVGLAVGRARLAADAMERAVATLRAVPASPPLTPEILMLYARALAADGALRVPDPSSDKGLRYRYDLAADVLVSVCDMESQRGPTSDAKKLLYDVYVRYGDLLASVDRPAMALLSYNRAFQLTGSDPKQDAARHGHWLTERLAEEETKALAHLDAAVKGKPDEVGTAMVELYVAYCRETKWKEADEAFAKLEHDLRTIPPELRMERAVQRFASLEDAKDQGVAESEIRIALKELKEPAAVARAKYELARVLEWQGTADRLNEAHELYLQAADEGVTEDWALDADERARVIADVLAEQLRAPPK